MPDTIDPRHRADWEATLRRVLRRTAKAMGWTADHKPTVNGHGPGDIVAIAVQAVFAGSRAWNPDRYPDYDHFLSSVAKSVLDAERRKGRRRAAGGLATSMSDDRATRPERQMISAEERRQIVERFGHEGIPRPFLELWLDNPRISNQEVSEATATTVREVENAKKRVRRYFDGQARGGPR